MLGIAEMIRSGTVCYNDMYFFTEQEIAAVEKKMCIRDSHSLLRQ